MIKRSDPEIKAAQAARAAVQAAKAAAQRAAQIVYKMSKSPKKITKASKPASNTKKITNVKSQKRAQLEKNKQQGAAAEKQAAKDLEKEFPNNFIGDQVTKPTALGNRRIDFLVNRPGQKDLMIEVKSGGARYGGLQKAKDELLKEMYDFRLMRY